uniref:Uncharacterized protein n=2 Tax=Cyprinus carpio TaxID=7962 RepID=A0A8C1H6G8_CYPCA
MKRSLIKWSVITHLNILNDSYFLLITQWCRFKCERGHTSALHEGRVHIFEGLDVCGHSRDPVNAHFINPSLLHLLNALPHNVRHLGILNILSLK